MTKWIFFSADNGYRNAADGGPIAGCDAGASCVHARYLAEGKGPDFEAAGIRNFDEFGAFYWREQLGTAGTAFVLGVLGGLGGGTIFWLARPKRGPVVPAPGASAA
ncbi:MAG: hypothetical protein ABIG85_07340 [Chloroflexota bacterium]